MLRSMNADKDRIETLSINAIRFLAADAVEEAKSGHPGLPMGMAAPAYLLWKEFLRHNPTDPTWPNRDRFVLSAGHGSMLLYALLHLSGYDLPLEELKRFRQWGSITPGHPEYGLTPGIEMTTGPLGQGISTAVGMALAEVMLAAEFNRPDSGIVDHYTYVIASDGDLMEGVSSEASSLAGHWELGKLIVLYDNNHISIDGDTELAFTEDRLARYRAYGWQVLEVLDANNLEAVRKAIHAAQAEATRPSLIAVRSHIGFGSPKQDSASAHGSPLGTKALQATREKLGWIYPPFEIPEEVYRHMRGAVQRGQSLQSEWEARFTRFTTETPELAEDFERRMVRKSLPDRWEQALPSFEAGQQMATRSASGAVLDAIASVLPELVGGSGDLTPSNNTYAKGMYDLSPTRPMGRYVHFGVREHAMGTILNGLYLHGGLRPYGGTFFIFSDYMRPAVRLAALMGIAPIFVWTHDSIGLGEDGPTHQPVEQLASLRAMPNLWMIRPADANETAYAWRMALSRTEGPSGLVLTRQKLPVVDRSECAPAEGTLRGGYILKDAASPRAVIIASGSEVQLVLAAQIQLAEQGIPVRVVSLPCWEAFEAQSASYRNMVLLPELPTVAVEAASPFGWERYADAVVGLDRFGASAPYKDVYSKLGFTVDAVVEQVMEAIGEE